eukprot:1141749-Pelagomonas_calceolata.AAC.6
MNERNPLHGAYLGTHACVNKAWSAGSIAYQCHLCARKDWLRQLYSAACDAPLTCHDPLSNTFNPFLNTFIKNSSST